MLMTWLLAPSLDALREMVSICETYATEYHLITQSVCAFNQSSNHLIADFSMIDSFSLHKLHSNYCMSLYGCELWSYNSRYINDIYVA